MVKIKKFIYGNGQVAFATEGITMQINKQDPIEKTVPTASDGETVKMLQDGADLMSEDKVSQ